MDQAAMKVELINEYRSYRDIISQKGISYTPWEDADLDKMALADLTIVVRHARDIARTPT